eukprot:731589-Prorocentrum_minimum.AAC.1
MSGCRDVGRAGYQRDCTDSVAATVSMSSLQPSSPLTSSDLQGGGQFISGGGQFTSSDLQGGGQFVSRGGQFTSSDLQRGGQFISRGGQFTSSDLRTARPEPHRVRLYSMEHYPLFGR